MPGELPRALQGDMWGEGVPQQGRAGAFCYHSSCLGKGIRATLHHRVFPRALCKRRDRAGIFQCLFLGKESELEAEFWKEM